MSESGEAQGEGHISESSLLGLMTKRRETQWFTRTLEEGSEIVRVRCQLSALDLDSETKCGLQQCPRKPWPSMSVRSPSSFLAGRVYLEELGNDSPHPGPPKVGWGARQMGRSSGHPRHPSIPLPSSLCHPGLNQTLPISHPPLRTRPLHTLPRSGLSHPVTGPLQTSPFHSSSQQSEASDLSLVLEATGRGQDRDWVPTSSLPPRCHEPRVR